METSIILILIFFIIFICLLYNNNKISGYESMGKIYLSNVFVGTPRGIVSKDVFLGEPVSQLRLEFSGEIDFSKNYIADIDLVYKNSCSYSFSDLVLEEDTTFDRNNNNAKILVCLIDLGCTNMGSDNPKNKVTDNNCIPCPLFLHASNELVINASINIPVSKTSTSL